MMRQEQKSSRVTISDNDQKPQESSENKADKQAFDIIVVGRDKEESEERLRGIALQIQQKLRPDVKLSLKDTIIILKSEKELQEFLTDPTQCIQNLEAQNTPVDKETETMQVVLKKDVAMSTKAKVMAIAIVGLTALSAVAGFIMYFVFPGKLQDIGINKTVDFIASIALAGVALLVSIGVPTLNRILSKSRSSALKHGQTHSPQDTAEPGTSGVQQGGHSSQPSVSDDKEAVAENVDGDKQQTDGELETDSSEVEASGEPDEQQFSTSDNDVTSAEGAQTNAHCL